MILLPRQCDAFGEGSVVPCHIFALRAGCPLKSSAMDPAKDGCARQDWLHSHQLAVGVLDLLWGA
eukprot:5935269-Heterocapsa_arctica.AAC.1